MDTKAASRLRFYRECASLRLRKAISIAGSAQNTYLLMLNDTHADVPEELTVAAKALYERVDRWKESIFAAEMKAAKK